MRKKRITIVSIAAIRRQFQCIPQLHAQFLQDYTLEVFSV